jgi:hypothetical protein
MGSRNHFQAAHHFQKIKKLKELKLAGLYYIRWKSILQEGLSKI